MNFDYQASLSSDSQRPDNDLFILRYTVRHLIFALDAIRKNKAKSVELEDGWYEEMANYTHTLHDRAFYLQSFVKDQFLRDTIRKLDLLSVEKMSDDDWSTLRKNFSLKSAPEDDWEIEPYWNLADTRDTEYRFLKNLSEKAKAPDEKNAFSYENGIIIFNGDKKKIIKSGTKEHALLNAVMKKKGKLIPADVLLDMIDPSNNDDKTIRAKYIKGYRNSVASINEKVKKEFGTHIDLLSYKKSGLSLNNSVIIKK